jgi:hypothetical protein
MKTKKSVAVSIGVLIGFVGGLLIGISLTNPGMSLMEAAGTIGKMDAYRNVKVTEQDIELRNELLTDASLRESYREYLTYEYAANVKMTDDIRYALQEVDRTQGFRSANARTMERLEDYTLFLENARLQILEAIGVILELDEHNQVAIRQVLNDAGNVLAQTTYRSTVLFDLMEDINAFFQTNAKEEFPQLALAHDRLFANLLTACLVSDNKPVLEHLLDKELMTENESLALLSNTLQSAFLADLDQLSDKQSRLAGSERLSAFMADSSPLLQVLQDIGMLAGAEGLADIPLFDSEQLGSIMIIFDAENLREGTGLGSQSLAGSIFYDASRLSDMMQSKEQLQWH